MIVHAENMQVIEDIVQKMNLMNIPSHSVDIRHMFRATPQLEYNLISDVINNQVKFTIDNGHKVETSQGLKFVTQLSIGDKIKFEEEDMWLSVKSIEIESASTKLCFDVI